MQSELANDSLKRITIIPSPCKVLDKVDGSMVSMYYYREEWHVASSSVPDGSG
jgi:hypothetical protein